MLFLCINPLALVRGVLLTTLILCCLRQMGFCSNKLLKFLVYLSLSFNTIIPLIYASKGQVIFPQIISLSLKRPTYRLPFPTFLNPPKELLFFFPGYFPCIDDVYMLINFFSFFSCASNLYYSCLS